MNICIHDKAVISKQTLDQMSIKDMEAILKEGTILITDGDKYIARIKKA